MGVAAGAGAGCVGGTGVGCGAGVGAGAIAVTRRRLDLQLAFVLPRRTQARSVYVPARVPRGTESFSEYERFALAPRSATARVLERSVTVGRALPGVPTLPWMRDDPPAWTDAGTPPSVDNRGLAASAAGAVTSRIAATAVAPRSAFLIVHLPRPAEGVTPRGMFPLRRCSAHQRGATACATVDGHNQRLGKSTLVMGGPGLEPGTSCL